GGAGPSAGAGAGLSSPADFNRAFTNLCLPPAPLGPALDEPRVPGIEPGRFFRTNPTVSAAAVRDEVARVVGLYDAVWTQAAQFLGPQGLNDARAEIRLSGLEARPSIAWLAVSALITAPDPPYSQAVQRPIAQEVMSWLGQTAVPIGYADVPGAFPNKAGAGGPAVGAERVDRKRHAA